MPIDWRPTQATYTGMTVPMPTGRRRYGEASTALSRYQHKINDRYRDLNFVLLEAGIIVVHDRAPWRVLEVREVPLELWPAKYTDDYDQQSEREHRLMEPTPPRSQWMGRPMVVVVVPDRKRKTKPVHLEGPGWHQWQVLPEHYSVCVSCGELPPCRESVLERVTRSQIAASQIRMEIPPGCCLGCGETITKRQKTVTFRGTNLWRPDLPDGSAVFHARRECSNAVHEYQTAWAEQHPSPDQLPLPQPCDDPAQPAKES